MSYTIHPTISNKSDLCAGQPPKYQVFGATRVSTVHFFFACADGSRYEYYAATVQRQVANGALDVVYPMFRTWDLRQGCIGAKRSNCAGRRASPNQVSHQRASLNHSMLRLAA